MTQYLITLFLAVLLGASVTFLAWFGLTRPWWKSWEGRALTVSSLGWSLVSGGFLLDGWRDVPDEAWVVVAGVAALASCLKLALLVLGHHRKP